MFSFPLEDDEDDEDDKDDDKDDEDNEDDETIEIYQYGDFNNTSDSNYIINEYTIRDMVEKLRQLDYPQFPHNDKNRKKTIIHELE